MTPTEHLAQGHTPYLKSCAEAGMSEGWTIHRDDNGYPIGVKNQSGEIVARCKWLNASKHDIPFIAATNGERPWAELLWEDAQDFLISLRSLKELTSADTDCSDVDLVEQEIINLTKKLNARLIALDSAGRLGWKTKENQ